MEQKLFLTIDLGTQSVRVSFINPQGEILGLKKVRYTPPYFSMEPGFAEIDPNVYMKYIGNAYRALVKEHNLIDNVIGVAITYFRDSVVIAKDDMVPLRPAILWLDQRRAQGKEKLPFLNKAIFKLAGVGDLIRLNRMRTPAHWIKENEPDIWDAVRFGAIAENVKLFEDTRIINFKDDSITENTRVGYPIEFIDNIEPTGVGDIPKTIFFLTCDAFGVLPPISKLVSSSCLITM